MILEIHLFETFIYVMSIFAANPENAVKATILSIRLKSCLSLVARVMSYEFYFSVFERFDIVTQAKIISVCQKRPRHPST